MKNYRSFIFFIAIFVLAVGVAQSALYLPVNLNEYRFLYDAFRRDEISGGFYNFNYNLGPYDTERLNGTMSFLNIGQSVPSDKIKFFALACENYRSIKDSSPNFYESFRGGFIAQPLKNFQIYSNFVLDEARAENPSYTGKKYRGLAGEVENAFIAYHQGKIELIFGRFSSFWGPTAEPVVLSSTARPMDALSVRFNWGKLNYSYQLARLDRYNEPVSDSEFVSYGRYFAGHRIDYRIFENFNLGLFETIIFSGVGQGLDLAYLNPLLFYHSFQLNENSDDNTFLGLDFCWYLQNRHKIYGQLMIDDYQVDDKEPGDKEPDEIGYLVGIQTIDLLDFLDIRAEYLKITNRTFNQAKPANRYINRGGLIGNELGPDGDRFNLDITKWIKPYQRLTLGLAYQRKGEGRVDADWDTPWLDSEGDYDEPFPTGIVEKTLMVNFNYTGVLNRFLYLDLTAGLEHIANDGHIAGRDRTLPFVELNLSIGLSTLLDIE